MTMFRMLLAAIAVAIFAYTGVVIAHHGLGLFQIFFSDMARMTWPGQFNLDFMCMLALSGCWVAWRHHFSPAGLALGLVAFVGGASFLSVYLLIVGWRATGGMAEILLGKTRAAGRG